MIDKLAPLGYYKWNWQEWRASRRVQRMSYIDRGLYRELLDEQWKLGGLPSHLNELADICGCPVEVMRDSWERLKHHFEDVDGLLINPTLEEQRTSLDTQRANRARAGQAGGSQRQANARKNQAPARPVLASASTCHIGEKRRVEESREEKSNTLALTCEQVHAASPAFITFPLIGKKTHIVTEADVSLWQEAYPAIDIRAELRKVIPWLDANPEKRSATVNGSKKRVVKWLTRAQDNPRLNGGSNGIQQRQYESSNDRELRETLERMAIQETQNNGRPSNGEVSTRNSRRNGQGLERIL